MSIFATDFKPRPWWWEAAEPPQRDNALPAEAEVLVVGGGYAGLSAALTLARLGHDVVVIDAERIGWGASSRNGGMVSGGLKVARGPLEKTYGPARAMEIMKACGGSFPFIEDTMIREGIDADYKRVGRFVGAWTPGHYKVLENSAARIAEMSGLPTAMVPRENQRGFIGSDHYHGGMHAQATGSLHPGKYARGLAAAAERAGARLVDGTRVGRIEKQAAQFRVTTDRGVVAAKHVLTATNGYSHKGPNPWFARRMVPLASYIIATEELPPEQIERLFPKQRMLSDTKLVLNYFRPSPDGRRVLWGGRASFSAETAEQAAPRLHAAMCEVFPELREVKITHAWTGNVAFTFDHLPHIGVQDGVHYAGGCQGSGVAMATWLGHNVALKIAGAANEKFALDDLPFPTRPLYSGDPWWFLPVIGNWYKLKDRIERMAA